MIMDAAKGLVAKIDGLGKALVTSRQFSALSHFPVAGGLLILAFLPFVFRNSSELSYSARIGFAAQIIPPLFFAAGTLARYVLWLYYWESLSAALALPLSVLLVAVYVLMAHNFILVLKTDTPNYYFAEKYLLKFSDWAMKYQAIG